MIKKLRKNFIIVTMFSTLAVLVVIIGILNIVNYCNVVNKADTILQMLADNGAAFPEGAFDDRSQMREWKEPPEGKAPPVPVDKKFFHTMDGLSEETPYETRYFTVKLDGSGQVLTIDTGRVASLEPEGAAEYAKSVWASGKKTGFY